MLKKTMLAAAIAALLIIPVHAPNAAEHGEGSHGGHESGHEMKHDMGHGGDQAQSHKGMTTIGEVTVDGIKAKVQIADVREAMAKSGMKTTHHLMVAFVDEATSKPFEKGVVAAKMTLAGTPEGRAMPMMEMNGQFGGDVTLDKPGSYDIIIATKFSDEKKRHFKLQYILK